MSSTVLCKLRSWAVELSVSLWFVEIEMSSLASSNLIGKPFHPDGLVLSCQECVNHLRLVSDVAEFACSCGIVSGRICKV